MGEPVFRATSPGAVHNLTLPKTRDAPLRRPTACEAEDEADFGRASGRYRLFNCIYQFNLLDIALIRGINVPVTAYWLKSL